MSLARYAKKRDSNEREIVDALRAAGALVCPLDRPVDLLVGHGGLWRVLEVKRPKGAVGAGQEAFMALAASQGLPAHVVRSADEALAVIGLTH